METFRKKIVIAGIIVVLILMVGIVIYLLNKKAPTTSLAITSSVPTNNASNVDVFGSITLTFNQEVNADDLTVTSDPSEIWTIAQVSKNSVRINHKLYLRVATKYKLAILRGTDVAGTLNFETAHDQNDPRQLQNLQTQLDENYPLASSTPYKTPNYRIIYSAPLTLEIDLTGPISSQGAITQVQLWVKSHGVDPSTHKYIVVSPSPTP